MCLYTKAVLFHGFQLPIETSLPTLFEPNLIYKVFTTEIVAVMTAYTVSRRGIASRRHFTFAGMAVIRVDYAPDVLICFTTQCW